MRNIRETPAAVNSHNDTGREILVPWPGLLTGARGGAGRRDRSGHGACWPRWRSAATRQDAEIVTQRKELEEPGMRPPLPGS